MVYTNITKIDLIDLYHLIYIMRTIY